MYNWKTYAKKEDTCGKTSVAGRKVIFTIQFFFGKTAFPQTEAVVIICFVNTVRRWYRKK